MSSLSYLSILLPIYILSFLRWRIMLGNFCISCESRIIPSLILSKSLKSWTEYSMTECSAKEHLPLPPQATGHVRIFIGFVYTQHLLPTGDAFWGEEPCQRDFLLLASSFQMFLYHSISGIMKLQKLVAITGLTCHTWNSIVFPHHRIFHS